MASNKLFRLAKSNAEVHTKLLITDFNALSLFARKTLAGRRRSWQASLNISWAALAIFPFTMLFGFICSILFVWSDLILEATSSQGKLSRPFCCFGNIIFPFAVYTSPSIAKDAMHFYLCFLIFPQLVSTFIKVSPVLDAV